MNEEKKSVQSYKKIIENNPTDEQIKNSIIISIKSRRYKEFFYYVADNIVDEFCIIHLKKVLEQRFGIKDYNFVLTHNGQIVKDNVHLKNLKMYNFQNDKK